MDEVLQTGEVSAHLTKQYDFRRSMDKNDFVSLMFYLGLLTVKKQYYSQWTFVVPNFVIRTLYFDYFRELLEVREKVKVDKNEAFEKVLLLAIENDIQPLIEMVETTLKQLSNRDSIKFDEKYVKVIFTTLFFLSQLYTIHNEYETDLKYVDLLCTYRRPVEIKYQQLIELKYLKKEDTSKLKAKSKEARDQLNTYLAHDKIKRLENLRAWAIVFVGGEAKSVECLK